VSRSPVLVKLGGSLITDKLDREVIRFEVLARLASELRAAREAGCPPVVLAHGSGSFGHAAAAGTPLGDRGRRGLGGDVGALGLAAARTQDAAARLHRSVIGALLDAGIAAFSLAPSSFVWRADGLLTCGALDPLLGALDLGLVPVGYGDVVVDADAGATICSTEELLELWATGLGSVGRPVAEALWLGVTDGLLDAAGRSIPQIGEPEIAEAMRVAGGSAGVDVTGGMRLRVEAAWSLARRGVTSWIVDGRRPGALLEALTGEPRGTRVCSERARGGVA
jgi:isopentenyl phosphate kinase